MGEPATNGKSGGRGLRLAVLAVSVLVGVSALWGAGAAVIGEPRVWGLLGFELVTVLAAAAGVMVGLGRPREAPGLAAACVGATIFAAATLGRFSAIVTRAEATVSEGQALRRLVVDPMFDVRLVAAVLLAAIAVGFALGSDRRAWRKLAIGMGLALPVAAVAWWMLLGRGFEWALAPVDSLVDGVRVAAMVVGGVALAILAAVSAQMVIGAFESRLPPIPGEPAGRSAVQGKGA